MGTIQEPRAVGNVKATLISQKRREVKTLGTIRAICPARRRVG